MRTDSADARLISASSGNYQYNEPTPTNAITFGGEVILLLFGFSAISAIAILVYQKLSEKWSPRIEKTSEKIPCPNCQYFSKSSYLRCAVRPKTTMTNEALDCTDYQPKTK